MAFLETQVKRSGFLVNAPRFTIRRLIWILAFDTEKSATTPLPPIHAWCRKSRDHLKWPNQVIKPDKTSCVCTDCSDVTYFHFAVQIFLNSFGLHLVPVQIVGQFGTGQFGTKIIKRTIWHQNNKGGQFGTKIIKTDNLAPGQFGTRTIWHRTIWHQDNLAPNIWYD